MDKKDKKSFQCEYCSEVFSTKQNKNRHILRKHKDIDLTQQTSQDDDSILSDNTTPEELTIVSINYQSDNEEPIPNPSDEYLIHLRNEYMKYEHLYRGLDNRMRWQKSNANIDMNFYLRKHNTKMKYILFKIALLNCNVQNIKT
jgi:hypothetical protein